MYFIHFSIIEMHFIIRKVKIYCGADFFKLVYFKRLYKIDMKMNKFYLFQILWYFCYVVDCVNQSRCDGLYV